MHEIWKNNECKCFEIHVILMCLAEERWRAVKQLTLYYTTCEKHRAASKEVENSFHIIL